MKKKTTLTIDPEILKRLQLIADKEHRTLSNLVEKILIEYAEKGGK